MARTRYLVAYDIADPRRLRLVHACVTGHGTPLQYSVFVCDLTDIELIGLRTKLRDIIHHTADSIAIIRLGRPGGDSYRFEFMGARPNLPAQGGSVIV